MKVPIGQIRPNPFQTRTHIDHAAIEALAHEIKALGYWGSLRARKQGTHYELCFGHRRLDALKLLKVKDVDLEVLDLSDEDMAIQGLVENMQREGLRDIEKAEGIKRLIERLETTVSARAPTPKNTAHETVQTLMGLSKRRINELLALLELKGGSRRLIEQGRISGRVAGVAQRLGGDDMIKTAAEHDLSQHTIEKISRELEAIAEPKIREKVTKAVIAGKVRDPEAVRQHARKVTSAGTKIPSDLKVVIRQWTQTMQKWTRQLEAVMPYVDYIEEDTKGASDFKSAARDLIEALKRFL